MKRIVLVLAAIYATIALKAQDTTLNEKAFKILQNKCVSYPFTFAVIGDPHPKHSTTGYSYEDIFLPTLEQISQAKPDFVICCGDLTDGAKAEEFSDFYDTTYMWMDTSNIPFFSVPGNHDYSWHGDGTNYRTYIGAENYYFDFANTRFMMINNAVQQDSSTCDYGILSDTYNDIKGWLSSMPANGFMFAHVPFHILEWNSRGIFDGSHTSGSCHPTVGPEPRYRMTHELLKEHNVRAFISGHRHVDSIGVEDGIPYIISGGVSGQMKAGHENHWMLFSVDENANISYQVRYLESGNISYKDLPVPFYNRTNHNLFDITENEDITYFAGQNLTAGNNYTISPNVKVKFAAGGTIKLEQGFSAPANSKFKALTVPKFTPCDNMQSSARSNRERLGNTDAGTTISIDKLKVYPNPAKGSFNISYKLNKSSNVNISIYNSLLVKMDELVNGMQNSGSYNISTTHNYLKAGIYYCIVEINGQKIVKKIILL